MALLALRSNRLNHRQGRVVCVRGEQYVVLLVVAADPVAVRPLNLRPIQGDPVYQGRPQELPAGSAPLRWRFGGPTWSCANVVTAIREPRRSARHQASSGSLRPHIAVSNSIEEAQLQAVVVPALGSKKGFSLCLLFPKTADLHCHTTTFTVTAVTVRGLAHKATLLDYSSMNAHCNHL